jgi:hypothetical protein
MARTRSNSATAPNTHLSSRGLDRPGDARARTGEAHIGPEARRGRRRGVTKSRCASERRSTPALPPGFHPTGTIATFGTTAASAKILGWTPKRPPRIRPRRKPRSGINQYEIDGSISKHCNPETRARNGILAAMLAKEGMTAPKKSSKGPRFLPLLRPTGPTRRS